MTNQNGNSRSTFSGKMGYVLAVAGSAVGLGNIWRFPYLAAEYGGGIFLLTYLLLAVTFGYTMIVSETALGRGTRKSPVGAFHHFGKSGFFTAGGWINAVIPMLILPYYSVIGGWVTRYLFEYLAGDTKLLATDTFFGAFVSDGMAAEFWFIVFTAGVLAIILAGVKNGIERVSKIMMPVLIVLAIMVAGYSVTLPGAWAGVTYFMVPNLEHFSWMTVVSAMGQMFYSLSVAMGILYTYGSYMKKEFDLEHATFQVIAFDSGISVLASLMIIPAVFAFSGGDPSMLNAGPSLMFITIPKVFESMGLGTVVGILFFTLVLFGWMLLNSEVLQRFGMAFDPYPFIFLNLVLSTLAALQAPVIMMSQNRQSVTDRKAAEYDYVVNLRAELEILRLHDKLDALRGEELVALLIEQGDRIERLSREVAALSDARR